MKEDEVIKLLGYRESSGNWVTTDSGEPETSHLWRTAKSTHVFGSYLYLTSPSSDPILPPRPAVHVARANSESEARAIHRNVWNLSTAPFLMVILPSQVRVYAGFNFDPADSGVGHLRTASLTPAELSEKLADFHASEIDSGRIWQKQAFNLTPERRVDERLLGSLEKLGNELVNNRQLDKAVGHALIGKYIYIRYLKDRRILSDKWLKRHKINFEDVLGPKASLSNLQRLVEALENRFNGRVFPLDLADSNGPSDSDIAYIASVFRGDDPTSGQLALDFQAYDFSYIPVETLSSIYEQFMRREGQSKSEGAVYTREFVADYLLCELNSARALKVGMRVLDPSCGSGVFLVLVYRRLIELELRRQRRRFLTPDRLREILEESIYGVEPSLHACYVAEFSLILTLLSYIDPPELDQNESFQFPVLHNNNIFQSDFFDAESAFWKKGLTFDWITGNPPWTKLKTRTAPNEQAHAWKWITDKQNKREKPVGKYSLSEAFTWRATDLLGDDGYVGLLVHATSLFNSYSTKYRASFFQQHTVVRITNFANLVYILFKGRSDAPAATFIYTKSKTQYESKPSITHYGPFVANQVFFRFDGNGIDKKAWAITIFEDEIQTIEQAEAETGDATVWKLALWGTYRDRTAIAQLKRLFPSSLKEVIQKRNWRLHQGLEFCTADNPDSKALPLLANIKRLDVSPLSGGFYLTVPESALEDIPEKSQYIKARGGDIGLEVAKAPHLFWTVGFAAYSDVDFVLPKPQIGLSAPPGDAVYLRALSAYLNSSLGQYLLFFHAASWGVDRSKFAPGDAEPIPVPSFSEEQVSRLAELHEELSALHISDLRASLFEEVGYAERVTLSEVKRTLDRETGKILKIPDHITMLARDFTHVRYQLNKGKTTGSAARPATPRDLLTYARGLTRELDDFSETHHKVSMTKFIDFVLCTVEITRAHQPFRPVVEVEHSPSRVPLKNLWADLEEHFSQWVYVRRSLRAFLGKKVHILKSSRLIDWTRAQSLQDSDDIIAEVLNMNG